MAPTTLDHILETYLDSAVVDAKSVSCGSKCLSYVKFTGEDLSAQGESKEAALGNLREQIRTRVYKAMNSNRPLPVISGIDITPGSC